MSDLSWSVCFITSSNMWVLFVTLLIAVPIFAVKEAELIENIPASDRKLLFELVKRLQDDPSLGQLGRNGGSQPKCEVSPNRNSIIKRKESEKLGAKNLGFFENVASNEACTELCCKNTSCDLAVFENKDHHYCYLFRCEGKCVFSHHSSYVSTDIIRSPQATSAPFNSEQDLQGLNNNEEEGEIEEGVDEQNEEPPAPTKPAVTSTQASQFIRAHSVGLDAYCKLDQHCEDPNGECSGDKCICQDGYYKKGKICRKVCAPSNFACLELGTIGRGPHCVDSSQVCDGTTQCADGSDEINCPDSESSLKSEPKSEAVKSSKQDLVPTSGEHSTSHEDASHDTESHTGDQQLPPDLKNKDGSTGDISHDSHDPASTDTKPAQPSEKPSSDTDSKTKNTVDTASSQSADTGSSGKTVEKTDGASPEKMGSDAGTADGAKNAEAKDSEAKDKDAASGTKVGESSNDGFFSQAKLDFTSEAVSMQGPIIALSLGLAFTFILLVFVACRLRTVRQRLRKGRPLHSNEADYLINGMYL